ncbi:hypothetical protein EJB05_36507, partial [Eragrostis curvula]
YITTRNRPSRSAKRKSPPYWGIITRNCHPLTPSARPFAPCCSSRFIRRSERTRKRDRRGGATRVSQLAAAAPLDRWLTGGCIHSRDELDDAPSGPPSLRISPSLLAARLS